MRRKLAKAEAGAPDPRQLTMETINHGPAGSILLVEGNVAKLRLPDVEWELELARAPSRLPLSVHDALGMGTHAHPVEPVSKGPQGPQVEYGVQTNDFHEYFLSGGPGPSGVLVVKRRGDGWVSTMSKSLLPHVLSKQAVKAGLMPPEGTSALPKSLERVVPVRMRYWTQPTAQAVQVRNSLVKSGMFHDRLLKLVDGSIRLCVERLFLYEPTEDELNKRDDSTEVHGFVQALFKTVHARTLAQPLLDEDWLGAMRKHAEDPHALMLLSSPDDSPAPVVQALLDMQPKSQWLVEHNDTPDARGELSKLGRLFKVGEFDDPPRVFVASFPLPGVHWLDSDLPMAGVGCELCGEPASRMVTAKADAEERSFVCDACLARLDLDGHDVDSIEKAVWTTAYINELPDSAFLYIAAGGAKDEDGKTKPRSLRYFPVTDKDGAVDLPHLRNAIARIPQSSAPGLSADDKKALQDKARGMLELAQKRDGDEELEKASTKVQSLIFDKGKFSLDEAKTWAKDHGFKSGGVDETGNSYRFRQFEPGEASAGSFRTIELKPGVKAVIGKPKESKAAGCAGPGAGAAQAKPKRTGATKSDDGASAGVRRILKAEERYVLGIILEPEAVDAQNDIYSAEEIRNAAHTFMEKFRTVGLMHKQGVNDKVKILESYITPCDMDVQGVPLKAGTWLMGVRVLDDDLWSQVKEGGLTGFSIGGSAIRKPEPAADSAAA